MITVSPDLVDPKRNFILKINLKKFDKKLWNGITSGIKLYKVEASKWNHLSGTKLYKVKFYKGNLII